MLDDMKVKEPEPEVVADEPSVVGEVKIFLLSNGGVSVQGPIGNPVLSLEIFGKAISTVAAHIAREEHSIIVPQNPDIIVPK